MYNVLLVIIVYTLICLYEVPDLIREKHWRDLAGFTGFLSLALTLSLLLAAGVKLPLIIPAIYKVLTPLLTWLGMM